VRDDAEVEDVLFGLLGAARPGTIVAIHSTIRPRTVVRLAETAAARGVHVLDVPVTGGAQGAEARTLGAIAGGDAQRSERCRADFETSASTHVPTGPLGSA
jgi:2-hydroxy-3-oxopropionate reductase